MSVKLLDWTDIQLEGSTRLQCSSSCIVAVGFVVVYRIVNLFINYCQRINTEGKRHGDVLFSIVIQERTSHCIVSKHV